MPNRILREGILTSERVNMLDWDAEVFYRRLMSVVDDFGRYTANPKLLRAALYPLQIEKVRDANIVKWLDACVEIGLVRVYAHSGASGDRCGNQSTASADRSGGDKRFLEMLDFRQQVRAKESKYPPPPSTCAADAMQMPSTCSASAHLDGGGDVDEDVDDTLPPRAREKPPDPNLPFPIFADWKPSPHFSTLVRQSGLLMPDMDQFQASLVEFIGYWLTQHRNRTQHEWDHAFIKNLKADAMRGGTSAQKNQRQRGLHAERTNMLEQLTGSNSQPDDGRTIDIESRVVG